MLGGALVGAVELARASSGSTWPSALAALVAALLVLPENSDPDAHRVDIAGTVLGAAALTAFTFAVIDGESAGFGAAA